jgi:hypothetical protein
VNDRCEIAEFFSYSEPVARKERRCCECTAPILKGEKHFQCFGRWSFGQEGYRQHLVCMEACILIRDSFNGGDCIGFGCLKEEFQEIRAAFSSNDEAMNVLYGKLRSLMAKIRWRERAAGKNKQ